MAAGIVYHQITTASGVTFTIACWVPNTAAPDVNAIPVQLPINSAGVPMDLGVGTGGSATPRVVIDSAQLSAVGAQLSAASVSIVPATDIATVPVSQDTNKLLNGNTALTPKFTKIVASASGVTTIVAAVTSKKIRVLAWDIKVNAAVNFKWQSHVTPTDLTGLYYNGAQGDGVARAFNPVGYFETVAGEALDINLSGAVPVGGVMTYVEV